MNPPPLSFTDGDSQLANASWEATCGPHALAAALALTLDAVRPAIPNYRGWMSPTQMGQALTNLGHAYELRKGMKTQEVCEGINRVQWEGPWLNPGVPPRVAYHHTHWVAHRAGWVFCTALFNARWVKVDYWRRFHLQQEPVSPFHITHHYTLK